MKKNIRKIAILIVIIITHNACTEEIDMNLEGVYETKLVVDGEITTEAKAHLIKLSTTEEYFYNEVSSRVSGAVVSISDGTNTYYLNENEAGYYYTDSTVAAEIGKTYTLSISSIDIDDDGEKEIYTAESTVLGGAIIDSIVLGSLPGTNYNIIYAYGEDEETPNQACMGNIYRNDTLLTDTFTDKIFMSDEIFNGIEFQHVMLSYVEAVSGDTVCLEYSEISMDYYEYYTEVVSELAGLNFVSGPPANVSTNISDGAVGYFVARHPNYITVVKH